MAIITGNPEKPYGLSGRAYDSADMGRINTQETYNHFFNYLFLLAVSRFQYSNLPETVSRRQLEESLIFHGNVLWFHDPVMGLLTLPSANAGRFNVYNIPTTRVISRANGYHTERSETDSVLMYNDATRLPFVSEVAYYAEKLTRIENAKDVNTLLQMRPKILRANKDNRNSIRNMLSRAILGQPYILYDEGNLALDNPANVLDLSVPCILPQLENEKSAVYSEYLAMLGINSFDAKSSAQQTEDEVNVSNDRIGVFRTGALESRQTAIDQVNRMFGTSISVSFAPTLPVSGAQTEPAQEEE